MSQRALWVVLGVNAWEDCVTLLRKDGEHIVAGINTPPNAGIGWMPVFASEEEAEAAYPSAPRARLVIQWEEDGSDA
jgi:hypothetical protein